MGNIQRIDFYDVWIKPKSIDLVKNAILGKYAKTKDFQYILKNLIVDSDGYLDWNWDGCNKHYKCEELAVAAISDLNILQYWCKNHYKCEELAVWLSKYCEGGFIAFWSQEGDGNHSAYEFDGKGGVSACSAWRAAGFLGSRMRGRRNVGASDSPEPSTPDAPISPGATGYTRPVP